MTPSDAAAAYAAALARAPSIGDQLRIPGSQRIDAHVNAAWALLEQAAAHDPHFAPVHAARANVLVRGGFVDDARAAYARAAELDPHDAASRYALGELATLAGEDAQAERWFAAAFERERLFSPPRVVEGARAALVLGLGGAWPRNIPLDFLINERAWTLHRWFLPDPGRTTRDVPPVDLIINALGESRAAHAALADAGRIIGARSVPAINVPARIGGLARDRLAATVSGVPGMRVARALRVSGDELVDAAARLGFPLLVRPCDTHGGRGLERVERPDDLRAYSARTEAAAFDCSAYVDYRSADGWFRKYRVIFVGGRAYPYHLAIDERWMIHYYRTATGATPWMQAEEASFLADPSTVLAGWNDTLPRLAAALGLDYVGIDCAQLRDGTLLVFEADTAMLVHALDRTESGRSKRAAVERISVALTTLFAQRAG